MLSQVVPGLHKWGAIVRCGSTITKSTSVAAQYGSTITKSRIVAQVVGAETLPQLPHSSG